MSKTQTEKGPEMTNIKQFNQKTNNLISAHKINKRQIWYTVLKLSFIQWLKKNIPNNHKWIRWKQVLWVLKKKKREFALRSWRITIRWICLKPLSIIYSRNIFQLIYFNTMSCYVIFHLSYLATDKKVLTSENM